MRARGLSRVRPRERWRRRGLWAGALLGLLLLVVLVSWLGRRPALETLLQAWLPGALGGTAEVTLGSVGRTQAEIKRFAHVRPGWAIEAKQVDLDYRVPELRAGQVRAVEIGQLSITGLTDGPNTGFILSALDWPVGRLGVDEGQFTWPGLPGAVQWSARLDRADGTDTMEGTAVASWASVQGAAGVTWQPDAATLTIRAEGSWAKPLVDLAALGVVAVPAALSVAPIAVHGTVEWTTAGAQAWGATVATEELRWQTPGEAPWVLGAVTGGAQGQGQEPSSWAAGGRLAVRAIGPVELKVGPFVAGGAWAGPWRLEAGEIQVAQPEGEGKIDLALRARLDPAAGAPTLLGSPPETWTVAAEIALRNAWQWGALAGPRAGGTVQGTLVEGQARVPSFVLTAPTLLRLADLEVDWSEPVDHVPQQWAGSVKIDASGAVGPDFQWQGQPLAAAFAVDLLAPRVEIVLRQESSAVAWAGEGWGVTGEVAGSAWLNGDALQPAAWGGEANLTWTDGEMAGQGWQASGVTAETMLKIGSVVTDGLNALVDPARWRQTPVAATAALRAWLDASALTGQIVASLAQVDGPLGTPVGLSQVSVSARREPDAWPSIEVSAEQARWQDVRLAGLRGRLTWEQDRPVVVAGARLFPEGWVFGAVLEGLADGGWQLAAEVEPVESTLWQYLPTWLGEKVAELRWRGSWEATAYGTWDGLAAPTVSLLAGVAVDLEWGDDEPVALSGVATALQVTGFPTLRSVGPQEIRIASIRSGELTMSNLVGTWSAPGDGTVRLESLTANWLGGQIEVDPMTWSGMDKEMVGTVRLHGVQLVELASLWPTAPVRAEGQVDGHLQVTWHDGQVRVGQGELQLRREGQPRLSVTRPGWLSARAAPGSREFQALETVERAAESLGLDNLVISINHPDHPGSPIWLKVEGQTLVPDLEAPITLEVNLNLELDALLNSSLWRQVDWSGR